MTTFLKARTRNLVLGALVADAAAMGLHWLYDFGTILFFQLSKISFPILGIMILAIINGLITSIILETFILMKQNIEFKNALKTAMGMSFISMICMEITMNITDYLLTGGAMLTWWVIPIMLIVGFLTPWPYNYWRLKKF